MSAAIRLLALATVTAAVVLAATGSAIATGPGPGERSCTGRVGTNHNVCVLMDRGAADQVLVHIGIDVTMSQTAAQQIIDQSGQEFVVVLGPPNGPWTFQTDQVRVEF